MSIGGRHGKPASRAALVSVAAREDLEKPRACCGDRRDIPGHATSRGTSKSAKLAEALSTPERALHARLQAPHESEAEGPERLSPLPMGDDFSGCRAKGAPCHIRRKGEHSCTDLRSSTPTSS